MENQSKKIIEQDELVYGGENNPHLTIIIKSEGNILISEKFEKTHVTGVKHSDDILKWPSSCKKWKMEHQDVNNRAKTID